MKKFFAFISAFALCFSSFALCGSNYSHNIYADDNTDNSEEADGEKIDETKWHINLHEAADAEFKDDGDKFTMLIKNPGGEPNGGADKWDVQLRCRGIEVKAGHRYGIEYQISSSKNGYYYTKIGNLDAQTVGSAIAGEVWHNQYGVSTIKSYVNGTICRNYKKDYSSGWNMQEISAGDTITVSSTFESDVDIPEAEWVFFLGGKGPNTPTGCFEAGTVLEFADMKLVDYTEKKELISYGEKNKNIVYGDIDNNGKVEINDLTTLSLYMLEDITLTEGQIKRADVSFDGKINMADIAQLMQYVKGDKIILGCK